jgi:hypothetical protein
MRYSIRISNSLSLSSCMAFIQKPSIYDIWIHIILLNHPSSYSQLHTKAILDSTCKQCLRISPIQGLDCFGFGALSVTGLDLSTSIFLMFYDSRRALNLASTNYISSYNLGIVRVTSTSTFGQSSSSNLDRVTTPSTCYFVGSSYFMG